MVMSDEVPRELGEQRMQGLILAELADVYLLFDYISGRSDKRLISSLGDGDEEAGLVKIQEICKIRLPPTGTPAQLADQAESLLVANDRLNAAANPANGESIAFTVLVTGAPAAHGLWHWLRGRKRTVQRPPVEAAASPLSDNRDAQSLARQAYPGLVRKAEQFNLQIGVLNTLLLLWLIFTCLLSWYVAVGHTILARVADIETKKSPISEGDVTNKDLNKALNDNLDKWFTPAQWFLPTDVKNTVNNHSELSPEQQTELRESATVIVEVLTISVLPLFYGFLGAGTAVVRNIWRKMRDSLLLPRDLTLSFSQLALGAVIGACIGLFFVSSSGSQGTAGPIGPVTLAPSALSFIAGFGVEGVFVMLESLIKRVFHPSPLYH